MFEKAEQELKTILALVELCPENLRADAFKILLEGYVRASAQSAPAKIAGGEPRRPAPPTLDHPSSAIPPDVQNRVSAMARRRNITDEQLIGLFDFGTNPFSFAPMHVPGGNKQDRTKKVALLVAVRSFLATGTWMADWSEVKAMCIHQNCYDVANFAASLKKAKGKQFKTVSVGTSVELSAKGTEEAEKVVTELVAKPNAAAK